jgi:MATE family multidrug resistance protein
MLGMLLYKVPWLLSLRFVGNIGSKELAAAALATTLCNVTGISLSVGLSSALTTLTGQARGDLMSRRADLRKQQPHVHCDEKKHVNGDEEALLMADAISGHERASRIRSTEEETPLLPLTLLYRGLFLQLTLVIPVGLWWLYGIKPVLIALGQGEDLSEMTQNYLRILTPGLWSYSINWTLTAWLQAIEMANVPAYAASVGLIPHIPLNMLFIHVFGWGYLGVAVATVMFQLIQPVLILLYLFETRQGTARVLDNVMADVVGRKRLSFWKEAKLAVFCRRGIFQYLGLALPGIVIISEWWASEVTIFLSGRMVPLPALALDGMAIYQSLNTFCFMFPVGISIAGSTRVGNFLGAGDAKGADFSAKVSVLSAAVLSAIMGSILFFTPHTTFPSIFSPDKEVILEASRTIPFLAIYVFADGIQVALNGIIKGCGRQCITMPVVVLAYWFVGVPLAYYYSFVRHSGEMFCDDNLCGISGLVAGMTTGTWVHMLLLLFIVVCTTNWSVQASRAKTRLAPDNVGAQKNPLVREDEANEIEIMRM